MLNYLKYKNMYILIIDIIWIKGDITNNFLFKLLFLLKKAYRR